METAKAVILGRGQKKGLTSTLDSALSATSSLALSLTATLLERAPGSQTGPGVGFPPAVHKWVNSRMQICNNYHISLQEIPQSTDQIKAGAVRLGPDFQGCVVVGPHISARHASWPEQGSLACKSRLLTNWRSTHRKRSDNGYADGP